VSLPYLSAEILSPFQSLGEIASTVCKVKGSNNKYSRSRWLIVCTSERLSNNGTFLRESVSTVFWARDGIKRLRLALRRSIRVTHQTPSSRNRWSPVLTSGNLTPNVCLSKSRPSLRPINLLVSVTCPPNLIISSLANERPFSVDDN
ncbi:uncharacterized protein METZ01_LOCUS70163, partial [marine metagenome]